jgi:hypothetical protein
MREKKAAAELEQMILKEVRNLPACQGLTGILSAWLRRLGG